MPKIPQKLLSASKSLRRKQTPWEAKLWARQRAKRIFTQKFRRQFRTKNFIVDFYCHEKRLIIELDGSHHKEMSQIERDKRRDTILNKKDYKILRFNNNDI